MMDKKESKVGFIWYSTRISFWIMVLFWFFTYVIRSYEGRGLFFGILFAISVFFTLIVSIIHLFKYKEKVFAIVSLIASLIVLFLIKGFLEALIINFVG